jgi:hypothetical protein
VPFAAGAGRSSASTGARLVRCQRVQRRLDALGADGLLPREDAVLDGDKSAAHEREFDRLEDHLFETPSASATLIATTYKTAGGDCRLTVCENCEHESVATPGPQTDRAHAMVKAFIAENVAAGRRAG